MRQAFAGLLCTALISCSEPSPTAPASSPAPQSASSPPSKEPSKPDAHAFDQFWVTTERLDRRTCPSKRCGVVGQLFFRESAHVYEKSKGWARITKPYDASCVAGRSEYVDRGQAACTEGNGIVDGIFAEWVEMKSLSTTRPADPAETAIADETLVAQSDDFALHRRAFAKAAAELIADRTCTREDFAEMGGWTKSVNQYRDRPVYFTYCGGMTVENKIYLDASNGKIFR